MTFIVIRVGFRPAGSWLRYVPNSFWLKFKGALNRTFKVIIRRPNLSGCSTKILSSNDFPLVFGLNSGPRRTFTDRVPKGMPCIEIQGGVVEGRKGTRRENAKIREFRENLLPVTVPTF
jgi:hypothetical protein